MTEAGITKLTLKEYAYKQDICLLIKREIYKEYKPARKEKWKLGKLHKEWNELLQTGQNLVIVAPRDHLKSFFFSEVNAIEKCRANPYMEILILSGSDGLAIERLDHIKKRWAKLPRYKYLLAGADIDSRKEVEFSNGAKIKVQGFFSKVRGGHPKMIILDDIIDNKVIWSEDLNDKVLKRLATEVIPMAEPDTQIIIVGTLQKDGDVYCCDWNNISVGKNKSWISRTYDAIVDEEKHITLFPEKYNWEELMVKKQETIALTGDDRWFNKEYRNMKVNLSGEIVKQNDIRGYDELPENCWTLNQDGTKRISIPNYWGWDASVGKDPGKGDFTAGIHFYRDYNGNAYIDKIIRKRIEFDDRLKEITAGGKLYPNVSRVAVEGNTFQYDSVQTLKINTSLPIEGIHTSKNKIEKFVSVLKPLFGNAKVFIKNGIENRQEFINELLSLPRGKYDDMADALCIGLSGLGQVGEPGIKWINLGDDDDDGDDLR